MSDKLKCIKGETCVHCGSTYCRLVDELQAKEKECEELKRCNRILLERLITYEEDGDVQYALFSDIDKLEEELQAEKEKVEELEEENSNLKTVSVMIDNNKYKQALEAIRMIAGSNLCDDDCDECPSNCECDWKNVTDKIDEVLNE